jgi:exodeoxyribonuclease-3
MPAVCHVALLAVTTTGWPASAAALLGRRFSDEVAVRIATPNINNVNKRLTNLLDWLKAAKPDVVCLQELKAADTQFPRAEIEKAGYRATWRGEKSWNGVAILARGADPIVTRTSLPGDPADDQSRYIEAAVNGVLIASLYAPNGNPQPGPKFTYAAWMNARPARGGTLCVRRAGRARQHARLSWTDAIRTLHPETPMYTFWDCAEQMAARRGPAPAFASPPQQNGSPPASTATFAAGRRQRPRPAWIELGTGKNAEGEATARRRTKAAPRKTKTEEDGSTSAADRRR